MVPLLEVQELSTYFYTPEGVVKAVNGVSFSLVPGKTLAVVGESGCGKSTLGRLLTLIEPPTGGSFMLDGEPADIHDKSFVKRMRQTVQMIFQDPYGSLNPRKKVGTILEEPLIINTKMSAREREHAARDMMSKMWNGVQLTSGH